MKKIKPYHIFSILFAAALTCPVAFKIVGFNWDTHFIQENRFLAKAPKFRDYKIKDLTNKWDFYFKDRLPFRDVFISAYIYLYEKILENDVSEYVTGKQGELIMNHAAPVLSAALGVIPYDKQRAEMLRLSVAGKYAYYYSKNIPFYLFIAPDKPTLYPNILPFYSTWIKHNNWYETELKALDDANVPYYNLKIPLDLKKDEIKLYDKIYDTAHWNGNALMIAYQFMSHVLAKDNKLFNTVSTPEYYSLIYKRILSGPYGYDQTQFINLNKMDSIKCGTIDDKYTDKLDSYRVMCTNEKKTSGTIWFYSDSYFGGTHGSFGVTPFVYNVRNYLHSHYSMQEPYTEVIKLRMKDFRPDAVVEEFVERTGGDTPAVNDPLLRILADTWLKTDGLGLFGTSALDKSLHLLNISSFKNEQINNQVISILKADNDDPIIESKSVMQADEYGRVVIMANYISPGNTYAQVYFRKLNESTFAEKNSVKQELQQGLNKIHITLHFAPFEKVWIRFDPGNISGDYIFEDIPELTALKARIK